MVNTRSATTATASTATPLSDAQNADLFGLDERQITAILAPLREPPYRARQVYAWLYRKRAVSIDQMSDLARSLRRRLRERFRLSRPLLRERLVSRDRTVKYLFAMKDGAEVESVVIPEPKRKTLCLSTQVGCPLGCRFCLTGLSGFRRNLDVAEILGQVAAAMEDDMHDDARPWNVVVMGMGEPLLNLDATLKALRILMDPGGFGVPPRRVTLSTVGILPALERFLAEPSLPRLAISLHAARPELRRALMPVEARFPIRDVLALTRRRFTEHGGRLTAEYVLLRGVNDSQRDARALVDLLAGTHARVNLIPLNPAPEIPYRPSTPEKINAFGRRLAESDLIVALRRPRGQDILAACGQLRSNRAAASASSGVS